MTTIARLFTGWVTDDPTPGEYRPDVTKVTPEETTYATDFVTSGRSRSTTRSWEIARRGQL